MATAKKESAQKSIASLINHAKKSGVGLKVSTVNNGGIYPVNFHLRSGASCASAAAFFLASGSKIAKSVPTEKMLDKLSSFSNGGDDAKMLEKLLAERSKRYPTSSPWGNFKKYAREIRNECRSGNIHSFAPAGDAAGDADMVVDILSKVK